MRPRYLEWARLRPDLEVDLGDARKGLLLLKEAVDLARDAHLLRFLFERQILVDFPDAVEVGFDDEALHVNEPDAGNDRLVKWALHAVRVLNGDVGSYAQAPKMKKVPEVEGAEFPEHLLHLIDSFLPVRFRQEMNFVDQMHKGHSKNCYTSVRQLLAMLINILDD